MEGLMGFYKKGIKTKMIQSPLIMFCIFLLLTYNIYTTLFGSFVVIIFVVTGMNKKSFNILTILPIKTKNIIEVMYLSLYIVIGGAGVIGSIVSSIITGEGFAVRSLVIALMLIMVNFLVPENFTRGMSPNVGGWFGLLWILYLLIGTMVIVAIEFTNFKIIIADYSIVSIIISILLVRFTLKSSYERILKKIYG